MLYALRHILFGVLLLVLLWFINTVIAFGVFSRATDVWFVLPSWLTATAATYAALWWLGYINRFVNVGLVLAIIGLVFLYLMPVNSNFPEDARAVNTEKSEMYEDKYEYARELFWAVEKRWASPVRQYLLEPHKVFFIKDAAYFWHLPEGVYVDSNVQAHLYRNLLLESGRFNEEEVWVEQHFCTNSPHGVVAFAHPSGEQYYADLWAVDNFDQYMFGQYTASPCDVLIGKGFN